MDALPCLLRVVVAEATERQQQVNDARRHFAQPRFEFRQQFATFLQASGFKAGVVSHHRAGFRQVGAQLAHEFRARVSRAFGEKRRWSNLDLAPGWRTMCREN
jgi:hypothetical protein